MNFKLPYDNSTIKTIITNNWNELNNCIVQSANNILVIDDNIEQSCKISQLFNFNKVIIIKNVNESLKSYTFFKNDIDEFESLVDLRFINNVFIVGGGVLINKYAFYSSVINRGLKLILVPTTPMSITDVAIGSKNSLNSKFRKNYIGTYFSPTTIYINYEVLNGLHINKIKLNSIESLKQFIFLNISLFNKYEDYIIKDFFDVKDFFNDILLPSIKQKIILLKSDPYETEKGLILHAGHYIAHSIEESSNFTIPHDVSVLIGLQLEIKELYSNKILNKEDYYRLYNVLNTINHYTGDIRINRTRLIKSLMSNKLIDDNGFYKINKIAKIGEYSSKYHKWHFKKVYNEIIHYFEKNKNEKRNKTTFL